MEDKRTKQSTWTYHTCHGVEDKNEIYQRLDEKWELSLYAGISKVLINYCPWCGEELERKE